MRPYKAAEGLSTWRCGLVPSITPFRIRRSKAMPQSSPSRTRLQATTKTTRIREGFDQQTHAYPGSRAAKVWSRSCYRHTLCIDVHVRTAVSPSLAAHLSWSMQGSPQNFERLKRWWMNSAVCLSGQVASISGIQRRKVLPSSTSWNFSHLEMLPNCFLFFL